MGGPELVIAAQVSTTLSATVETVASTTSLVLSRATSRRSSRTEDEDIASRNPASDTIDMKYFGQPGSAGFKVRGENYLSDKKKVCAVGSLFPAVGLHARQKLRARCAVEAHS